MGQTAGQKKERMHFRLDTASKSKIERAAAYSCKSVSDFVLTNAMDAAEKVIREHERIILGDRDRDLFFEAILNPPEPNKAMREAMTWYRGLTDK
jgi:uncharacterized protein (DUF1778 family)